MTRALFEQAVKVGDSRYIHARSAFNPDRTRCGLANTLQTFFKDTDQEVTCRTCKLPRKGRNVA